MRDCKALRASIYFPVNKRPTFLKDLTPNVLDELFLKSASTLKEPNAKARRSSTTMTESSKFVPVVRKSKHSLESEF